MGPVGIAALVAAVRAARAASALTRTTGGIKNARSVGKVYKEGSAAPIPRTQAQINEEGLAKARAVIGATKATPAEMVKRARANKANEIAKIKKQGRNTR